MAEDVCVVCGHEGESVAHVFVHCHFAKAIWDLLGFDMQHFGVMGTQTNLQWSSILGIWKQDGNLSLGLYAGWLIWFNRNQCLHHGLCKSPASLLELIGRMAKDSVEAQTKIPSPGVDIQYNWIAPSKGILKLNLDPGYDSISQLATCGVVLRDQHGDVLVSAVACFCGSPSPLQAELRAILFGLELMQSGNFKQVLVESDSLLAVKEINASGDSVSLWYGLISDIVHLAAICNVLGASCLLGERLML
ncbi:hypothetical protein PTKIN_Ptkin12aG0062500 [Pterospermum kingtungense]